MAICVRAGTKWILPVWRLSSGMGGGNNGALHRRDAVCAALDGVHTAVGDAGVDGGDGRK